MSGKRRMKRTRRPNAMRQIGSSKRKQLSPLNKIPPVTASQTIVRRQRYDFTFSSGGNANFTPSSFAFAYFIGLTATTARNQFTAVRIRRIEMWVPPSTNGGVNTASVEYPNVSSVVGSPGSRDVESVATTMGASECGHVVSVPDSRGLAGMWLNNEDDTTIIVAINAPVGSLVDITYDLILGWDGPTNSPFTYSGLTVANPYIASVRNSSGAISMVPVGSVNTD